MSHSSSLWLALLTYRHTFLYLQHTYYFYFSSMAASSARSSSSHESASTAASTAPYAGSSGEALPLRLSLAGGEPGASRREPTWLGLGRGRDEPT